MKRWCGTWCRHNWRSKIIALQLIKNSLSSCWMTRRPILIHSMLTSWCPCRPNVWPPSLRLKQQRRFEDPLKPSITWFSGREEDRQQLLLKTQQREREREKTRVSRKTSGTTKSLVVHMPLEGKEPFGQKGWSKTQMTRRDNIKIITRDSFHTPLETPVNVGWMYFSLSSNLSLIYLCQDLCYACVDYSYCHRFRDASSYCHFAQSKCLVWESLMLLLCWCRISCRQVNRSGPGLRSVYPEVLLSSPDKPPGFFMFLHIA